MADFCSQCSLDMYGRDFNDLTTRDNPDLKRLYTICEGCGFTVVDKDGHCIGDCLLHHGVEPCQTAQQFHDGVIPS